MNATTITVDARIRRKRIALTLVRVAALIGSVRLARFAVGLIRAEYRIGGSHRWQQVPLNFEVTRRA